MYDAYVYENVSRLKNLCVEWQESDLVETFDLENTLAVFQNAVHRALSKLKDRWFMFMIF